MFLESREDLLVELSGRSDAASARHSGLRGLAARSPFDSGSRLAHVSDPSFEDALRVVQLLDGSEPVGLRPERAPRSIPEPRRLSAEYARDGLQTLVTKAMALRGDVEWAADWVEFDQEIRIARSGQASVRDRRRGCRVRLRGRLESLGASARVSADLALEPQPRAIEGRLLALAEGVASRLELRLDARDVPPGEYPVVFAPGVGGVLLHEIVGHALEADTALAGSSWLATQGDRVASADLTVLDDPRRGRAPWRLDDDGEPARPTPLLRDGRVAGWLHDLRSAKATGRQPTGHGRCASYREEVRPRMGCTFMGAGRLAPQEVLEGVSHGIYVRRMEAAATDPASGHAVFRVTDSDSILDGRLGRPLRPHLLGVEARRALGSIDRLAYDLAFDACTGSCVRDGQAIAIGVGGPTFRIGLASAV